MRVEYAIDPKIQISRACGTYEEELVSMYLQTQTDGPPAASQSGLIQGKPALTLMPGVQVDPPSGLRKLNRRIGGFVAHFFCWFRKL